MKIAATISNCYQVSQEQYRDVNITKIFNSSQSMDEIIEWAKSEDSKADFHSIKLSVVTED